jgi:DeoR/GlpR family transcriptional regulator of sugar metabolism
MIKAAAEVIVLADSSKFGRRSVGVIEDLASIDRIVTDSKISTEIHHRLSHLGIEIIMV